MSLENQEKIQEIFNDALEIEAKKRKNFIKKACDNNPDIEAEVFKLLEQFEEADAYFGDFEKNLAQSFKEEKDTEAFPIVSNYEILKKLGEGGMAKVFLAKRNDGNLEQTLALKLLKRGLDTDKVLQRFEYEKQILASLQHPNLAQIYDAGISQEGLPFFVMEYVEGLPLLEYCQKNQLTLPQRLEIFKQICEVLQYAHQNLIIHRDLKPSNILVNQNGQVKLLDFGIAKILRENEPELTQTGKFLLTPNYASPEQLLGEKVSTQSDIYQLGIILHELLVSQRPIHLGESINQWQENIKSLSPDSLSNSWNKLDIEDQKNIAQERKAKLGELNQTFKGDLANIPLKCLETEAKLRYQSVGQLKEDLERYEQDLPLLARKPSKSYQIRKFIKRNKVAVLFSALLIASLFLGIIMTTWQAQIAYQNQKKAEKEQRRAEQISAFLINLFKSPDPRNPLGEGKDITLREFLGKGIVNLENELSEEPELQLELLGIVADMYDNLSYYQESKALEEKLLPRYKKHYGEGSQQYFKSKLRIIKTTYNLGNVPKADTLYQEILVKYQNSKGLQYARVLNDYALFLQTAKGNFPTADSLLSITEKIYIQEKDTLNNDFAELLSSQGLLKNLLGQLEEAKSYHERELAISQEISRDPIPIALAESDLSTVLQKLGKLKEAEKMQLKSLKTLQRILGEDHIHSIHALNNLAVIYLRQFELKKAEETANQVLKLYLEKLGESSYETGIAYLNTVTYLMRKEKFEEALNKVEKAKEILGKIFPPTHYLNAVPLFAESLIYAKTQKGNLALAKTKEAEAILENTIPKGHDYWGVLYSRQASAYLALNDLEKAKTLAEESYKVLSQRLGDKHYNTQHTIKVLVEIYEKIGDIDKSNEYAFKILQKNI